MSDDYEYALGGLRGHIVYGEQTAGDTPVEWMQVKVALPYLRGAERALIAERQRADAAEASAAAAVARADAAIAAHAALAAAVQTYLTLQDIPGPALLRATAALDAALAAAGVTR